MGVAEVLFLGIALGTDAFSVSVAIGTKQLDWLLILKLSLVIGAFHILMPLIGIQLGYFLQKFFSYYYFQETIDQLTTAIGAGLLLILGMIMIYDSMTEEQEVSQFNLYGFSIIILAFSVSIDALSVGFSLGMLDTGLLVSCLILGVIAALMVVIGLLLGTKLGNLVEKAEVLGGITLILLGIHFILTIG
ncbi:putative membrane protein [Halobacteroides halobius DSM 5150]|uniref:Putative manganese efflux pump MntP n=1 Tax=Halobacteroides halobius (strain ATCC 35273 / DSM 5150 / MD-1) TaxID=748449 RepID=L0KDB1_HALHC|nr:manganese efflux pump [Halobacteroides halobius]AGB42349.1 putative membrane protein [Halobacteroides halobius DSM 5150]